MPAASLEERVGALEQEVAKLRAQVGSASSPQPWWDRIFGTFADDPIFDEAMRLGREYREAQKPLPPPA